MAESMSPVRFYFTLLFLLSLTTLAHAEASLPECKVALRILTSAEYLQQNRSQFPDLINPDQQQLVDAMTRSFNESLQSSSDQEQLCVNTIRRNLAITSAYQLPPACTEFLPQLKKSFTERVALKGNASKIVDKQMADATVEMLILGEIEPAKLLQRCNVGMEVMRVNLKDAHLRERYPLPAACEVFFAEMEKTMILPAQYETIQRQRVIFALENKTTPDKLIDICEQISK